MRKRQWMALLTIAAFGMAACGGDANGSDSMSEMDNMDNAAGEMANDAGNAAGQMADGAGMADDGASDLSAQELPEGVTMAMIEEGDNIFHGAGICSSCHGANGAGLPNLGANLTDTEWLHSDGSYDAIVQTIMNGVTAEESTTGVPMPPKAGTNITDDQVKAAAAYVWSLSK